MHPDFSELQRQLLGAFFEESFEGLENLESGLLSLGRSSEDSSETINDVFRVAHSIKGGAGSFGLHAVGELGHAMETLLDSFRAGKLAPDPESLSLLLEAVDVLRELLTATRAGNEAPSGRVEALCARLTASARKSLAASARKSVAPALAATPTSRSGAKFSIHFAPLPHLLTTGNEPVRLLRELARLGDATVVSDTTKLPDLSSLDTSLCYLSFDVALTGDVNREQIADVFAWVDGDADLTVSEETEVSASTQAASGAEPATPPAKVATGKPKLDTETAQVAVAPRGEVDGGFGSLRVSVDRIDLLMNMVGELVITQSMLGELDDGPLDARRIERLREGLGLLARNTRSLQESVMRLRSMPISMVFNRFPRLVHDLCRQLGKQVELKIVGQNTELDKTVLEKLGDPLVHLVRNSMDHGIETPEARRAAGKPETGTLELRAYHRGGDIVVEVQDDGKGIDRDRVIERARKVGILGPDEVPGDDAIRDLIFAPGFSTASAVTDISGRGVGMDVVRRNVRSLGGEVFVDTTPGKGTRISLRLPLTLAIIDGQIIRVGEHSYVVPLLSIVESVQLETRRVSRFQGKRDIYRLRDQLIPMVDLRALLGMAEPRPRTEDGLMVIVEADGDQLGLLVDELLAQQQVVVKSLEANYGRVEGLAGATILGDGAVSLILDMAGVGRLVRGANSRDGARAA